MKNYRSVILFCLLSFSIISSVRALPTQDLMVSNTCDVLYLINGERLEVKILSVSKTEVSYEDCSGSIDVRTLERSKVSKIEFYHNSDDLDQESRSAEISAKSNINLKRLLKNFLWILSGFVVAVLIVVNSLRF